MRRLSAAAWTWVFGAYCWLATTACAAWFLRRLHSRAGHALGVSDSLLWEGLIYGGWLPIALLIWLIVRRFQLRPPAVLAFLLLGIAAIPGHALFAVWVDGAFSVTAGPDLPERLENRLPIDLLIYTALGAVSAVAWLQGRTAELTRALAAARQIMDQTRARPEAEPPQRLMVGVGRRRVPVDPSEIEWLASAGNYVVVHWDAREGLIRDTLQALEQRLDPQMFARSHRSTLVNLARVTSAASLSDGSWRLTTSSGGDLIASRTYRDAILARLGRG